MAVLLLCLLTGCVSTKSIYNNYNNLGSLDNGVDAKQAKIIAQKKLINAEEKDSYRISFPDIKTGPVVYKYPGYWFVVFGHNWLEPMSQSPYAGTYRDLIAKEFLVVIGKETGNITFFGEWYPKRENDFDWVFDQDAYKRKDPLALPPGRQSKEIY